MVTILLELGAEPNVVGGYGQTPLHIAASRSDRASLKTLLAVGADPLRLDAEGKTAVDLARRQVKTWESIVTEDLRLTTLTGITEDDEGRRSGHSEALEEAKAAHHLLISAVR